VFLSFLLLRDFRNYERLELPLERGISLFFGRNAAGKTKLLEACYYLSTGRRSCRCATSATRYS
jgi:DNA replication and repair protein RecF